MSSRTTRLAPSPTGALHLGNIRTFLINWAIARQEGWIIRMRIEDLDGPRVKRGAEAGVLDLLDWLGMDWDDEVVRQSDDLEPYREAMRSLAARGFIYPCRLTRKEIAAAATAPHAGDHEPRYPPHLRPDDRPESFDDERTNWRLIVSAGPVEFADEIAGPQRLDPHEAVGDFVVWTKRGEPAYQLAVVVDDHRQNVTDIVRGDDLLDSAARQLRLMEALSILERPRYFHVPLVLGTDGRRLAKRHGDTRVSSYREAGAAPERIIGLIAAWSGVIARPAMMAADEWADRFSMDTLPRRPVIFTNEDDEWLRSRRD